MRLVALGSGDAFCSEGRGHTAWLGEGFCVDFGATALQAMKKLGRDPLELEAVHFTHLHGDHVAGWPFLLLDAMVRARRTAPLLASGPPGLRERLEQLFRLSYADTSQRPLPFEVRYHELLPGERTLLCAREVQAFEAKHMRPPHVALSLRIGALAFTGDTGAHAGLTQLFDGARVLCVECTDLTPGNDRHLSWEELKRLLPRGPRILLGHLGSEARLAAVRIEEEARALGLDLSVCDDLQSFECGAV